MNNVEGVYEEIIGSMRPHARFSNSHGRIRDDDDLQVNTNVGLFSLIDDWIEGVFTGDSARYTPNRFSNGQW